MRLLSNQGVITGDSYDIRSHEVFQKLNWLPMNTHFQVRENITTFKSLTGNSPHIPY